MTKFLNHTSTKICENSRFFYVSYGKNTGNKMFQIFGPFLAISGKIRPKFCHRYVHCTLAAYIFTRPLLSFAAEESANWKHCPSSLPPYPPPSNIPENYPVVIFCFYISTKTTLKEKMQKALPVHLTSPFLLSCFHAT